MRDYPKFWDHFFAHGAIGASLAGGLPWKITDTSSAGTPTYAPVSPSACGEFKITLAATSEVENVCLDFGDILPFDIDNIKSFEAVLKVSGMTSGTTLAFGLQSARADDTDATTNNLMFKAVGSTALVVETDDGTTDNDDVATSAVLATSHKIFKIDLTRGKSDVRFYINGEPVATGTTFDVSAATGSLQPFFQLQKAANTNVDSVTIDYCEVKLKRVAA